MPDELERLRADLAAARFSEREWRHKAQEKIAEVERLQALQLTDAVARGRQWVREVRAILDD